MYVRQDAIVSVLQLITAKRFLRPERRSCTRTRHHIDCHRYQGLYRVPHVAFSASTLLPLTGNPLLLGLSWLSSSRPRDLLSVPGHITVRRMLSPAILLPTPAHVERSTRDTNPMGGFAAKSLLTNFEHDGQFNCKNRTGMSASPTYNSK